jgi:ABC-type transport system substrate-binding protein
MITRTGAILALLSIILLGEGCDGEPWNQPYPASERGEKILYSSFSERPKHLDPARSYSSNEYEFIAQIYEPPLQYHYLQRPYRLVPLTAEAVPRPRLFAADGTELGDDAPVGEVAESVYEIHIRKGIRYQPHPAFARDAQGRYLYHRLSGDELESLHSLADFGHVDSRELTAADYVHQIKRLAHPGLHSPILGLMSEYIVGLGDLAERLRKEYRAGEFLDLTRYDLAGAQVVDRYTYRLRIKGKYPQFIYWLAMPFFAPMPPEADRFYAQPGLVERNITLDWYPLGTGPYLLAENNPNRRMVLERNPNFHGETYPAEGDPGDREQGLLEHAGQPLPFIDKAVYSLEKEDIPYWNKFLQGYYDVSKITSDSFDQAVTVGRGGEPGLTEEMRAKGMKLVTAVSASTYYFGFNMLDPVVGGLDERAASLRRAIAMAVDYEEYISIFLNGRGVPAQGPLPPGIFGYREGRAGINRYVYDWREGRPVRKSLEEARRLLAEAGYAGGIDPATGKALLLYLDLPAGSGPDDKARLDWWRKQFRKLGLRLVVRNTDYNRFQEKMRKGTAQMFIWGWNADYPDPENFLFLLYGPNGKVEHGGENAANYANPRFDALFERMKNQENGPERQAIIDRMVEILRHDSPWLWGFHPKSFTLHHGWYGNVKPNLMANNLLKYRTLDPVLRAQQRRAWNQPVLWPLGVLLLGLLLFLAPAVLAYRQRERSRPIVGEGD